MAGLTQAELQRKMELFIDRGKTPQAQAVLALISYVPSTLDAGLVLLRDWQLLQQQTVILRTEQKNATRAEADCRKAVEREAVSLTETVRIVFGQNDPILTSLGVQRHYQTIPGTETEEPKMKAVRPVVNTSENLARWRLLFANAQVLPTTHQTELTNAGWPLTRIVAGASLAERYAKADNEQKSAIQAYQAASVKAKAAETAVKQWYTRASGLARIAIKKADPTNQQQLLELLGLN